MDLAEFPGWSEGVAPAVGDDGEGDVAVLVPVTLMASCWPAVQWPAKVQM